MEVSHVRWTLSFDHIHSQSMISASCWRRHEGKKKQETIRTEDNSSITRTHAHKVPDNFTRTYASVSTRHACGFTNTKPVQLKRETCCKGRTAFTRPTLAYAEQRAVAEISPHRRPVELSKQRRLTSTAMYFVCPLPRCLNFHSAKSAFQVHLFSFMLRSIGFGAWIHTTPLYRHDCVVESP